jgi:hypothetical protein
MKKQLLIMGLVALLFSVGLSGCNSSTEQTREDLIIGTWKHDFENYTAIYTFFNNHSVYFTSYKLSMWLEYEITEDHILFTPKTPDEPKSLEYSFTDNNQKLIFTEKTGNAVVFTRQ